MSELPKPPGGFNSWTARWGEGVALAFHAAWIWMCFCFSEAVAGGSRPQLSDIASMTLAGCPFVAQTLQKIHEGGRQTERTNNSEGVRECNNSPGLTLIFRQVMGPEFG
jgi:hypothetical protein